MDRTQSGRDSVRPCVVALCGSGVGARYLVRTIQPFVDLAAVVWERPSKSAVVKRIWRRSRRLGWFYPVDRCLLVLYSRLVLLRSARQCPDWRTVQDAIGYTPTCRQMTVASVNDEKVQALLTETKPDLVVVSGTSIIGKRILRVCPCMVNLHAGITPLYRGAHGGVWAVIQEDFKNVGATIHEIDEGIDTGRILKQVRIAVDPLRDNILTIAAKQKIAGVRSLVELVQTYGRSLKDCPAAPRPAGESRLYCSPGLRDYRFFERRLRERVRSCCNSQAT